MYRQIFGKSSYIFWIKMIIKFTPMFMHGGNEKNVNVQNVQSTEAV